MTGRNLLLTDRDRRIVAEVSRFGVMTREQIQRLRFFHSGTRAKERLKRLVDAHYLDVRRQPIAVGGPRAVYLPGPMVTTATDRQRIQGASAFFLQHHLGLVDIRIAFEGAARLTVWLSDRELAGRNLEVIADAYLECVVDGLTTSAFIEYDRGTETLGRIDKKARGYIDLAYTGRFARTFSRKFFRVLIITNTAGRLDNLNRTVHRLTDRIFRFALLSELQRHGPLASIWRRPGAKTLESLTEH